MEKELTKFVQKVFGNRVISLLYYGSHAFGGMRSAFHDRDFLLILDKPDPEDIKILRRFLSVQNRIDLSVQYQNYIEMKGPNAFQQGIHGVFFLKCLATAKCLLGTNVFTHMVPQIHRKHEQVSLLFQCEEYFFRLRQCYLRSADDTWKRNFRKYLLRIMIDMLLAAGEFRYEQVSAINRSALIHVHIGRSKIFNRATKQLSTHLLSKQCSATNLLALYQHLYNDYYVLHLGQLQNMYAKNVEIKIRSRKDGTQGLAFNTDGVNMVQNVLHAPPTYGREK